MAPPLRIGYVPEHFSTPLHFASTHFNLTATLTPFPSGTGHMVSSLRANEIDVGIGLTEGWVAGLADGQGGYSIVGTYVETPLCWAISTGKGREDLTVERLKGRKCGVSRVGSGSYVMSFVLAEHKGWLQSPPTSSGTPAPPFSHIPLQTFAALRKAVNDNTADFFLWEHFTSKGYYDSGEIMRIGDIYTPWSSWKIVAQDSKDGRLPALYEALDKGVSYFEKHPEEAVAYVSTELDYSEEDARAWLETVKFAHAVKGVEKKVVESVVETLRTAGVVKGQVDIDAMIGAHRA